MKKTVWMIATTLVVCVVFSAFALGQDKTELKGLVTARTADTMTVQTTDGAKHAVVLTDETKVQMPKGLGLRHKQVAWTSLMPGLPVKVKGSADAQGQLVASVVEFTKESLHMASMIQAGLQPTQADLQAAQKDIEQSQQDIATNQQNIAEGSQKIQENTQQIAKNLEETNARFDSLADYDIKGEMVIYFKPGSSTMSAEDEATLAEKAAKVTPLKGYLIEVKGFADSTGNAAMNQTLSRNRAETVIDYLLQKCDIPARHILAPAAMGISNPVASNETTTGRKENRRVEIKLMINKAVPEVKGD